jgi:zinc protease
MSGSRRGVVLVVCAVSLLAACAGRQPPPAPLRRTDLTLTISKSRLRNGLRVVLVHDPDATEVQVTMRYQVGAVDDPPDQAGMAHLVEHLMFEQVLGTRSLFAHLEDSASRFNAFTSFDATTYFSRGEVSALGELLSVEAVRLGFRCTTIDDSTFVREREVVLNEIALRTDATDIMREVHRAVYPADHPYVRSIGGSQASVAAITRDQACAFADAHYATTNAVLVVSGPIVQHELDGALAKFVAKVGYRRAVPSATVPRVEAKPDLVEVAAPISEDAVLVAWPLPADPALRARVRAAAGAAVASIDSAVAGRVVPDELGDRAAPMLAVLVSVTEGETLDDVVAAVKKAVTNAPAALDGHGFAELREIVFNTRMQGAMYELVAELDDRGERDIHIAAELLAGHDPGTAIGAELAGVRALTRDAAAQLIRDYLGLEQATVVALDAAKPAADQRKVTLRPPVHDVGLRTDAPDPAEATRPVDADAATVPRAGTGVTRRTLPNGLTVVLVPSRGVAALEARMIFATGTADEPAGKRGVALVAGHALTWNLRHLYDILAFSEAGGAISVDVGLDYTSFAVRGLAMHVDYLLAGLRRRVRDGKYDRNAGIIVDALRQEAKIVDDEGVVTDAWRSALFGPEHPYASAGLVRHVSQTLSVDDVAAFRAEHFTPANATLVIAGKFDPVLTNQWIDFLFADWTPRAAAQPAPRTSTRATIDPTSTAVIGNADQIQLRIAMPVTAGGTAQQLVTAEIVAEIASDVRHQLGASYDITARRYEARLATGYAIEASIDAPRLAEAIALLRTRLEELRTDADARARWFVTARRRVIRQLRATSDSAAALADATQWEIALGRDPSAPADLVGEVHDMTVDAVDPTLADIDLARAAILMTGRAEDLDKGFAVLGRTPTRIRMTGDDDDAPTTATTSRSERGGDDDDEDLRPSDLDDALTEQPLPSRLALSAMGGYGIIATMGARKGVDVSGFVASGGIGWRVTATTAVGLVGSIGTFDGTYDAGTVSPDIHPIAVLPLAVGPYIQGTVLGRFYAGVGVTLHRARITDDQGTPQWQLGAGVAADLGIDIIDLDGHLLGVAARVETQLGPKTTIPMISFGVAYRH